MLNIGLIGCGYWGPNLLRNFSAHPQANVRMVAELDSARLDYIHKKYPQIKTTKDYFDLFCDDIDAVVIATDPASHFPLAQEALLRGKHVLVEKPLAMRAQEAQTLLALAEEHHRKLMVGHTFEFNAAVQELKTQIELGIIGKPYYFYTQRLNFGIVRSDVNALWSLAPHDISILIYVLDEMPLSVSARGFDFIQPGNEDIVFMILDFPNGVAAHVHVSWLDPSKVRRMSVVGSDKMIIYDDIADNKIQIFDKGIKKQNMKASMGRFDDFGSHQLVKSAGDVYYPKIDFVEPLKVECNHFIEAILEDKEILTDGYNGLRVVQVLEAAQRSLKENGKKIRIAAGSPVTRYQLPVS
ncbi:MAG TPA: Gfo/Idh/MocA family oxidoreductase [Candidatus Omnitrophota bacterium]|nr:Gfo/Idh/MocA family oxidoreductase [Candidatus Omnitrophota bacterium]